MSLGTTFSQALTDLQAALANLQTQVTTLQTAVTNGVALLTQFINAGGLSAAQIASLESIAAGMNTAATSIGAVDTQISAAEAQAGS